MNGVRKVSAFFILIIFASSLIVANGNPSKKGPEDPYLKMIVGELSSLEEKAVGLANEFPEDKFSWRPAEGIRSVSESFIHMCGANYWLSTFGGMEIPESFPKDAEKVLTSKEDVIKALKGSFEQARKFIASISPDQFEEIIKLPFGDKTKREVCMIIVGHGHEHVGQLIAYARSTDVVPPWSKKDK